MVLMRVMFLVLPVPYFVAGGAPRVRGIEDQKVR